jgi:hypothetical protein
MVWTLTENEQNNDTRKGIRTAIQRKENHGMTHKKMVQSGTRRHHEERKELQEIEKER